MEAHKTPLQEMLFAAEVQQAVLPPLLLAPVDLLQIPLPLTRRVGSSHKSNVSVGHAIPFSSVRFGGLQSKGGSNGYHGSAERRNNGSSRSGVKNIASGLGTITAL